MKRKTIQIEGRTIGQNAPVFIIAEIAQAHDGSLGNAFAYIDAVAKAGANAIKFQTHIAEAESTPEEPWRVKFSPQDDTRFEYWQRMEFAKKHWIALKKYSEEKGLIFLSSAFSFEAVNLLESIGMPAWKVGSGEICNHPMLRQMARTGKPILLSSGMSSWQELSEAVEVLKEEQSDFALFQCTTSYPCPATKWGLNLVTEMQSRFDVPIGFSDHSAQLSAGIAATALGADMLEVHVVFSKHCFGPDTNSSLTIEELADLRTSVDAVRSSVNTPIDKDQMAKELAPLHQIFTKSIVAKSDLKAGEILSLDNCTLKKPGTGIAAREWERVIGQQLKNNIVKNQQIKEADFAES